MPTGSFYRYSHCVEIRELKGYTPHSPTRLPIWGERLGIYHPITSRIHCLDPEAWAVYDSISTRAATHRDIVEKTGFTSGRVGELVRALCKELILVSSLQDTVVKAQIDFATEAELYMQVTEACNFACPGCATGVDRFKAGQAKTLDLVSLQTMLTRAVESADRKGIRNLRIKWAGGEVLLPLAFRLLKDAQPAIRQLQEQYPQVLLSQIVLTNSSHFRDEVIELLKQMNTHVSCSLWGLGTLNDVSRGIRRPMDRFASLIDGIRRLHESGVPYNIDHVVTPGNAALFSDFIRAVWDTESDMYLAKDWHWDDGKKPIALGIEFFRPQTKIQMLSMKTNGYNRMIDGIRQGFATMVELIDRGIPIQPFDRVDYLQLFGLVPAPCGTGYNYFAAGPRGVVSCHQGLFDMQENIGPILRGEADFIETANSEYAGVQNKLLADTLHYGDIDPTVETILKYHGGSGCPRTAREEHEGELGHAASTAQYLYAPIIYELLAVETMRRIKRLERKGGDTHEINQDFGHNHA